MSWCVKLAPAFLIILELLVSIALALINYRSWWCNLGGFILQRLALFGD